MKVRRKRRMNPEEESAAAGDDLQAGSGGAHGARRAAHAFANLRGIKAKLRERSAERVAMHAELFRCFALVATMTREDLEDVTLFELAHSLRVRDAGGEHLKDEAF